MDSLILNSYFNTNLYVDHLLFMNVFSKKKNFKHFKIKRCRIFGFIFHNYGF